MLFNVFIPPNILMKRRVMNFSKSYISDYKYSQFSSVAQLCLTLCDPMDCSLPGFSVHGIFQAKILEWVAISFSRGSSHPSNGPLYLLR